MQVMSVQPLDVALPASGDGRFVQIPMPAISIDVSQCLQFRGTCDIHINLSMLPPWKLHLMKSMIVEEIH